SHDAGEIDTVVERLAIDRPGRYAVGERAGHARDASIGVQVAELRRLHETNRAAIESASRRELIAHMSARRADIRLSGDAVVALSAARAVDQAVAFLAGLVALEDLRDAAPERKRRVRRRRTGSRKAGVTGGRERADIRCAELIHGLIERVFVD